MCEHCMRKYHKISGDIKISDKRISHLQKEFDFATWDRDSVTILYEGAGDQPQFFIKGYYNGKEISWASRHPGGTVPRMFLGHSELPRVHHKVTGFSKATFSRKEEIKQWLMEKD